MRRQSVCAVGVSAWGACVCVCPLKAGWCGPAPCRMLTAWQIMTANSPQPSILPSGLLPACLLLCLPACLHCLHAFVPAACVRKREGRCRRKRLAAAAAPSQGRGAPEEANIVIASTQHAYTDHTRTHTSPPPPPPRLEMFACAQTQDSTARVHARADGGTVPTQGTGAQRTNTRAGGTRSAVPPSSATSSCNSRIAKSAVAPSAEHPSRPP